MKFNIGKGGEVKIIPVFKGTETIEETKEEAKKSI